MEAEREPVVLFDDGQGPPTTVPLPAPTAPEPGAMFHPADAELTPSAAARVADGWAASTRTGYARDWTTFSTWCSGAGRRGCRSRTGASPAGTRGSSAATIPEISATPKLPARTASSRFHSV